MTPSEINESSTWTIQLMRFSGLAVVDSPKEEMICYCEEKLRIFHLPDQGVIVDYARKCVYCLVAR